MAGLLDEFARSFDSGEDEEQSPDAVAQAVVNTLDDDDIDEEMSEAEKRLSKAAYYKSIIKNGGVIEEDGTPQAAEVNAEAKTWARQKMAELLGVAKPVVADVKIELPFTPNEITALKKLAGFALAKMGELPADPVVKKVEAPKAPTVKKVASQQPKKVERTELQGKPAPAARAKPQPGPNQTVAGKKTKPAKVVKDAEGKPDYESMPSGQVFKDVDGNLYKMVDNPRFDPEVKGSKPRTKLKVTNQVKGVGAFPTPNKQQMEAITASQSQDTVNTGASASATSPFGSDTNATPGVFVAAAAGSLRNE